MILFKVKELKRRSSDHVLVPEWINRLRDDEGDCDIKKIYQTDAQSEYFLCNSCAKSGGGGGTVKI